MSALERGPMVTAKDIGSLWIDEHDRVWRMISYAAAPTAEWVSLDAYGSSRTLGCVVGAPLSAGLRRLVPEGKP